MSFKIRCCETIAELVICIRSTCVGVFSVDEYDAGDVQLHEQVDGPPRVCCPIGMHTTPRKYVRVTVAVVSVVGAVRRVRFVKIIHPRADLERRAIECHVDVLATVCHHYTKYSK